MRQDKILKIDYLYMNSSKLQWLLNSSSVPACWDFLNLIWCLLDLCKKKFEQEQSLAGFEQDSEGFAGLEQCSANYLGSNRILRGSWPHGPPSLLRPTPVFPSYKKSVSACHKYHFVSSFVGRRYNGCGSPSPYIASGRFFKPTYVYIDFFKTM